MTRNQKIAIGCGGVGCLGLLVVICAGALFYWLSVRRSSYISINNSNYNLNANRNLNDNSADSPSSVTMSDDDKHRLFQAAGMTKDNELIVRVLKRIGMMSSSGVPSSDYQQFMDDHRTWGTRNYTFIRSVLTPEKARAYVDAHLDD
jgi:hypothetical protein